MNSSESTSNEQMHTRALKRRINHEEQTIVDIDQLRREYSRGGIVPEELAADPIDQFRAWLAQAVEADICDPTAMVLATVSADGQPSQRIVLLKHVDERGFVFFTNYESRKAREIAASSKVSMLFPWHALERQVKIGGTASKVSVSESLKYFLSRPKDSQIAAAVSAQSRPISSRQVLLQQFQAMKEKFADRELPLPDFWGGYRIVPHEIEFWQGRENRLHDCFVYRKNGESAWNIQQLAP